MASRLNAHDSHETDGLTPLQAFGCPHLRTGLPRLRFDRRRNRDPEYYVVCFDCRREIAQTLPDPSTHEDLALSA
jgi:hypothetical protein